MMYYHHFSLSGAPFQFTPSPGMLFASRSHREGLAALEKSFLHGACAITLLSGPAGAGKTTLALAMLARDSAHSRVVYLANPKVGCDAMLREILRQLGIAEHGSQYEMVQAFRRYLGNLRVSDRIFVLIDEAHHLSDATLGQIAGLNLEDTAGISNLSFGLIGRPELNDRIALRHPSLDRLILARVKLSRLSAEESPRYVEYRLTAYEGTRESVFAPDALDYLLHHASGSPMLINVLCHNAMLLSHRAGERRVEIDFARAAVQDFTGRASAADFIRAKREPSLDLRESADPIPKRRKPAPQGTVIALSKAGMGIGLLILCLLTISVVWLAEMRSQERQWNNDGEVPSIFSDDFNSTDTEAGASHNSERSSFDINLQPTSNESGVGKRIAEVNRRESRPERQIAGAEGEASSAGGSR